MTSPTSPPPVAIAGLRIPAPLVPRIIAALRASYPTITEGKDDEAVVRAVLKWIIETTLTAYEGRLIEAGLEGELEKVRNERAEKARLARERARQAAALITEAPSGEAEPNVPLT